MKGADIALFIQNSNGNYELRDMFSKDFAIPSVDVQKVIKLGNLPLCVFGTSLGRSGFRLAPLQNHFTSVLCSQDKELVPGSYGQANGYTWFAFKRPMVRRVHVFLWVCLGLAQQLLHKTHSCGAFVAGKTQETCNAEDVAIGTLPVDVIYAFGTSHSFAQHRASNRGILMAIFQLATTLISSVGVCVRWRTNQFPRAT